MLLVLVTLALTSSAQESTRNNLPLDGAAVPSPSPSLPAKLETSSTRTDAPPLQQADGQLQHNFSVRFRSDEAVLSRITGLESLTYAATSDGGGISLELAQGVGFPTVTTVRVLEDAGIPADRVADPLQPPTSLPVRPHHRIITMFHIVGTARYLVGWRSEKAIGDSLTIWNSEHSAEPGPVIAFSRAPILGAATQLSMHGIPEVTVVVWTRGRSPGKAVVGMYAWNSRRAP